MAITANTETVSVKVELKYDKASGDKAAKQVADFQRKQEQKDAAHKKSLEQAEEKHQQKLRQAQEMAFKKAELRIATSQKKIVDGTKSWSQRMTAATERVNTSLKAMAIAFVSTQLVQGIKNLATDAIAFAGDMQTLSDATELTIEQLTGLQYAGTLVGVKFGAMERSFDSITNKLQEAQSGSKAAQEAFGKLGIDFRTAGLSDVVAQLIAASQNTENFSNVVDVLGQKGASAYKKLATIGDITTIMNEAREAGALMTSETAAALDKLGDKWDALKMQLRISVGEGLLKATPEMTEFMNTLSKFVREFNWAGLFSILTNLTTALIAVGSTAKKTAESGAIEKVSKGFALSAIALPALPPLFIKLANAIMKIGTGNAYKASIIMQRIGEILANWENVGMAPKLPAFFESLFTGISKISGAITKLFVLAGKIPWLGVLFRAGAETFALYIEGILIAWDTMRIKMSQISWWEALGLAVIRASARLGDFVAMLIPFWDPKLVEQFDKQMSKWKTWSRWLDSEADKKSKKLSTPEVTTPDTPAFLSGVEPTAEATKQLEDWQKTVLDHKIELMDYMAKEYILAKNLAIAYKEVADAQLKGVSLKEMPTAGYETFIPFSKIATPAYKDTRFSGDVAAENAMGVATVQLAENRKQVLANAEAFRRLGDSGKYTKEQMAQLANILGIETPKAMSGWEIASQALYNVGSAMQSLLQVQQNLRAADEAEHQRKMERLNTELDAIREQGFQYTEFYRNKEKLANQENKEHVKTMSRMFKFQRAVNTITAVMDSYLGFNSVMKDSTLPTLARLVIAPSVLAMGLANAYAIASQPTPKFATGGRIGGNPYGDNTTVLAQGGEFITNQRATRRNLRTLESINNGVNMDGGSGISVNITGNVIGSREFVRDTLVPEIRKALRDGYTIA